MGASRLSQVKLPDESSYNLSIPFVEGTGSTAGTWLGSLEGLTEYYDGLLILYKPSVKGASTTTLNINSLGAKTCYANNTSKLTTHFPVNQPILLSYSTSQNSGCWISVNNYWDGNTNVRQTLATGDADRPLLMSYAETSNTTANVDNVSYRNNSIYANPFTGKITATNLNIAPPVDNATFPSGGITVHDVRNVTSVPTTGAVNFIKTNEGDPISNSWYSGIYCKGSGGTYAAWELVGCANDADTRTSPFYVRGSNKTTAWGDWRKLYDSSNPPTASEVGAIPTSSKGAVNGVAELDNGGKVPTSQLPSYVDDVLEYSSKSAFPATGETGKIYVALDTNLTYRWSGTAYVEISPSLALGETSSTAYRGDRGKTAYDHSQSTHARTDATAVSFTRNLTSGTKVGTITINGTGTDLYCQTNTDTKVSQLLVSDSQNRPILMAATTNTDTTSTITDGSRRANSMYANASTGTITANKYNVTTNATIQYNSTTQSLDFVFA